MTVDPPAAKVAMPGISMARPHLPLTSLTTKA